jgi:hypothetical protein
MLRGIPPSTPTILLLKVATLPELMKLRKTLPRLNDQKLITNKSKAIEREEFRTDEDTSQPPHLSSG